MKSELDDLWEKHKHELGKGVTRQIVQMRIHNLKNKNKPIDIDYVFRKDKSSKGWLRKSSERPYCDENEKYKDCILLFRKLKLV